MLGVYQIQIFEIRLEMGVARYLPLCWLETELKLLLHCCVCW